MAGCCKDGFQGVAQQREVRGHSQADQQHDYKWLIGALRGTPICELWIWVEQRIDGCAAPTTPAIAVRIVQNEAQPRGRILTPPCVQSRSAGQALLGLIRYFSPVARLP